MFSQRVNVVQLLVLIFIVSVIFSCAFATDKKESSSWKLLKNKDNKKDVRVHYNGQSSQKREGQLEGRQSGFGTHDSGTDLYKYLAISAFASLFGALIFELASGASFRSLSTFSLPSFGINVSDVWSKASNILSDIDWVEIVRNVTDHYETKGGGGRVLRDVSDQTGISTWIKAYQRDPVEYQCIRKYACQLLAQSPLVAKSMSSPFGGRILSAVGFLTGSGRELKSIVKSTVGNPQKCKDMVPWGLCEGDNDDGS